MLTRPRFRESFHVEVMEPEYVMLLTETQVHAETVAPAPEPVMVEAAAEEGTG